MNIILISSTGLGIYPQIEKSIEETFLKLNHSIVKIDPVYSSANVNLMNRIHPDLVITMVGHKMDQNLMELLKKKNLTLCIWLTEDPFYIDYSIKIIEDYDYIFTVDLGAYEFYKNKYPKKHIYHLPLGTDPSVYYDTDRSGTLYDLCLVGYPYPERLELVHHILNMTPHSMILAGPLWKGLIRNKDHLKKANIISKWIDPHRVREIFTCSKIILNPHRSHLFIKNKNTLNIESKSINNRAFDIAACGRFQLLTDKPDIEKHFDPTSEMVSYSKKEECIHLIYQYLSDEKKRFVYSKNAYKRVLNNHTFFHRIQFMLDQIFQ